MKLLIDANLSPRMAKALEGAGHDCVHVADIGLLTATDAAVFEQAFADDRVIVSADTDFGALLARTNSSRPSFVLLRHTNELTPDDQIALLIANLPVVAPDLDDGAVVTITSDRLRIRKLPLFP